MVLTVWKKAMRLEVSIPDQLYSEAQRAAAANGLSFEAYMAGLISRDVDSSGVNDDNVFTPEVVAEIRAAAVEARTGNNITLDQFRAEAKLRNAKWQGNHLG